MVDETTPEALRRQLREIDAEIAELRASTDDLKAHIGPEGDGVEDAEEIAADLTNVEEQEAVLGTLDQRRDAILKQLERLDDDA
jgi:pyrimidine operon attenuation protein/uracil phosphoribosyltransferase